jgi:hypothetical protein
VCDGSELAKWRAEHLLEFVLAIKGRRFFFPFGTLFDQQKSLRRELAAAESFTEPCNCGSTDFYWRDEIATILADAKRQPITKCAHDVRGPIATESPSDGTQRKVIQLPRSELTGDNIQASEAS